MIYLSLLAPVGAMALLIALSRLERWQETSWTRTVKRWLRRHVADGGHDHDQAPCHPGCPARLTATWVQPRRRAGTAGDRRTDGRDGAR